MMNVSFRFLKMKRKTKNSRNMYMLWFNLILGLNLIFPLFQTHYHTSVTMPKNKGKINLRKQGFEPQHSNSLVKRGKPKPFCFVMLLCLSLSVSFLLLYSFWSLFSVGLRGCCCPKNCAQYEVKRIIEILQTFN